MRVFGLIADDLTGAGDASVQFAARGWPTFLTLNNDEDAYDAYVVSGFSRTDSGRTDSDSHPSLLAVTTDCRALSNEAAEQRTYEALQRLMTAGIERIFLKIDSTMRGSVPGQIAGALRAWRTRHADACAVVCPAYPHMGRTVESNRLLVHGQPVHETAIGRDPISPVRTSEMSSLLPSIASVVVPDAVSGDDLREIAARIAAKGPAAIAVGSGGLAGALAEVWSVREIRSVRSVRLQPDRRAGPVPTFHNPRILLLVTSLNPVSHAQVARLKREFPDVAVVLAPTERVPGAAIADDLAEKFAQLAAEREWDVFGLIGGDGARAALKRLGASGIRIVDAVIEGIPMGFIAGGSADGTAVFTKAGGFGAEDAIFRVVERIRA